MKKIIKYGNKTFELDSYTSAQEKDLLLATSGDYTLSTLFDILKPCIKGDVENLTDNEVKMLLVELRNISVGETFSLIKKCNKCSEKFDFTISFEGIEEGNLKPFNGINFKDALTDEYNDFVDFDIDELDIQEYDELINYIDENKTKFNFTSITTCPFCNTKNEVFLTDSLLGNNMSEDTLQNYYQTIANMIYHGHYSKLDIDSMLPFERSIYLSLLNEEIKKSRGE